MKMYNKPITDVLTLCVTVRLMAGSQSGTYPDKDQQGDNPFGGGAPRHL